MNGQPVDEYGAPINHPFQSGRRSEFAEYSEEDIDEMRRCRAPGGGGFMR